MASGSKFPRTRLGEAVERVFIVAHTEDVSPLERALLAEGFSSEVIRPSYTERELQYSNIAKCLLNHRNAWRRCADRQMLCMVAEADFVPVIGLAGLPLPFPLERRSEALGWLYACGPVLYDLEEDGYVRGHAAAPVATVMGPRTAQALLDFAEEELDAHDPMRYFPFDTHIRDYLARRGIHSYLPYRNYGEHGGIPNPEHGNAGLTKTHRADVLDGPLHFMPAYARGSRMAFAMTRLQAKIRGVGRLATGRYLMMHDWRRHKGWRRRTALIRYAVGRLMSLY